MLASQVMALGCPITAVRDARRVAPNAPMLKDMYVNLLAFFIARRSATRHHSEPQLS